MMHVTKPEKPTPDFPLFAHAKKQWAKKIAGKTHYFGPWDDPAGALARYELHKLGKPAPKTVSAAKPRADKPKAPNKGFPLFPHANGQWAKNMRGTICFFGVWADPEKALERYGALLSTGSKRTSGDGLAVRELVNRFLANKAARVQSGEISQRSFDQYRNDCERLAGRVAKEADGRKPARAAWKGFIDCNRSVETLGPTDFEQIRAQLAARLSGAALGNAITRIRSLFKYAYEQDLIAKPIRFGQGFNKPAAKVLRSIRNKRARRLFTAEQVHQLLFSATVPVRAMIYLGLNCGMGNHDCATLPKSALDLKEGNFDYPRPKTGVLRWAPLWPETVKALKAVADVAREAKDSADADLFFLTKAGHAWYRENSSDDPIAKEMAKLLQACGMKKLGLGFYALRHTFLTVAEGARDQKAVEFIMGHAPDSNDMTAHYREEMKRERLKKVTDHVRKWLLAGKPKRKQSAA